MGLLAIFIIALIAVIAVGCSILYWFSGMDRAGHNDRDYNCRYWWGDRNGSAVGVMNERCLVCNPVGPGDES
jgi:hypothetical protein